MDFFFLKGSMGKNLIKPGGKKLCAIISQSINFYLFIMESIGVCLLEHIEIYFLYYIYSNLPLKLNLRLKIAFGYPGKINNIVFEVMF